MKVSLPNLATSLNELKKGVRINKIHTNTFSWWKNLENWSSISRDNLAQVNKKNKLRKVKYIARLESLAMGLKS